EADAHMIQVALRLFDLLPERGERRLGRRDSARSLLHALQDIRDLLLCGNLADLLLCLVEHGLRDAEVRDLFGEAGLHFNQVTLGVLGWAVLQSGRSTHFARSHLAKVFTKDL